MLFRRLWIFDCCHILQRLPIARALKPIFSLLENKFLVDVNEMFPWQYWGFFSRRCWWNICLREDVGVRTHFAGLFSRFQYAWCRLPGRRQEYKVVSHGPVTFGRSICLVERMVYTLSLRPYLTLFWGTERLHAKSRKIETSFSRRTKTSSTKQINDNRFCATSGLPPDHTRSNQWRKIVFFIDNLCFVKAW